MYNVILVDDESYMLEALQRAVDWEKFNMKVVSSFENSNEAFEFFKTNHVDLVIIDIVMPKCNGIELIEKMNAYYSNAKYFIISAHQSFDYAAQAIRLSVFDYITKPVDFEILADTLSRVKRTLSADNDNSETDFSFLETNELALKFIADNNFSADDFCAELNDLGFNTDKDTAPVYIMDITINNLSSYITYTWKHGLDRLYSTIINFVQMLSKDSMFFLPIEMFFDRLTLLVVTSENRFKEDADLNAFIQNYESGIAEHISADLSIDLKKSYANLCDAKINVKYSVNTPYISTENPDSDEYAIKKAIDYANENYHTDIPLSEISRIVAMAPSHFCRIFKKITGENFVNYVNKIRIEKARDLIISTDDSINSIYEKVGFNSKNYFYKIFKSYYNTTPNQYRKNFENYTQ